MTDFGAMSVTQSLSISSRTQGYTTNLSHMHGVTGGCGAMESLYSRSDRSSLIEGGSIMDTSDYNPHGYFPSSDQIFLHRQRSEWVTLSKPFLLMLVEKLCQLSFGNEKSDTGDDRRAGCCSSSSSSSSSSGSSVNNNNNKISIGKKSSDRVLPVSTKSNDTCVTRTLTTGSVTSQPLKSHSRNIPDACFSTGRGESTETVSVSSCESAIRVYSFGDKTGCEPASRSADAQISQSNLSMLRNETEMACEIEPSDCLATDSSNDSTLNQDSNQSATSASGKIERRKRKYGVNGDVTSKSRPSFEGVSKNKPQPAFLKFAGAPSKRLSKKGFLKTAGKGSKKVPAAGFGSITFDSADGAGETEENLDHSDQPKESNKQSWVAFNKSIVYRMIDEALGGGSSSSSGDVEMPSIERNQMQISAAAAAAVFFMAEQERQRIPSDHRDRLKKISRDRKRVRIGTGNAKEIIATTSIGEQQHDPFNPLPQLRQPRQPQQQHPQQQQSVHAAADAAEGRTKQPDSGRGSENATSFVNCDAPILGALLCCDDNLPSNPTYSGDRHCTYPRKDCPTAFQLQAAVTLNNNNNSNYDNNSLEGLLSDDRDGRLPRTETSLTAVVVSRHPKTGSVEVRRVRDRSKSDGAADPGRAQHLETPVAPRWVALDKCEVRSLFDSVVASMMMSDESSALPAESNRRRPVLSLRNSTEDCAPSESERNVQCSQDGNFVQPADDVSATVRRHSCCSIQNDKNPQHGSKPMMKWKSNMLLRMRSQSQEADDVRSENETEHLE